LDKIISVLKAYKAAIIWAAFVLFISLLPGKQLPELDFWDLNIGDKIAHIGVFFVLGLLLIYGSYRRTKFKRPTWVYLFVFPFLALLYGVLIEIFQGWFTTTRYASMGDVLADAIGAVLGTIIAFYFFKPRS
jgi:VanZ family protein